MGHFANQCNTPDRRDTNAYTHTAAAATANEDESENEDTVCALFTALPTRNTHTVTPDTAFLAVDLVSDASRKEWILDSGASMHMCCDKLFMKDMRKPKVTSVTAANKAKVSVHGEGDVLLQCNGPKGASQVILKNVLYVPDLTSNLVSVSAITRRGLRVNFVDSKCLVVSSKGNVVLEGNLRANHIYRLNLHPGIEVSDKRNVEVALKATASCSISLWHRRLAHLNATYL